MVQSIKIYCISSTLSILLSVFAHAQSYVTYTHDEAKMNQITVMEIGAGGLTPTLYYDTFHRNYQKSASAKNKMSFRTLAGISAYQQVESADSIKSSLVQRAEVEALNVADRQVDIAWLAEKDKITSKMNAFEKNINRIISAGGNYADKERWTQYYNIFQCAVKATQEGYMPNSERQEQYMQIYKDIKLQDKKLKKLLLMLKQSKTPYWCNRTLRRKDALVKNTSLNSLSRWKSAAVQAMQRK